MGKNENEFLRNYILITPAKNEESHLPNLIESIINQKEKPILWIIVDDGSTDRTPEIIKQIVGKNDRIKNLRLDEGIRDRGSHLAGVIIKGINFAYNYCKKNALVFNYIGVVDADVVLEPLYFNKLLDIFEENLKLGVASGELWLKDGIKDSRLSLQFPDGGDMLIRKVCLENCGGYPLTISCDSILNAKAKLRGWEIGRFDGIKAYIKRDYCHSGSLWQEYKKVGENYYRINYDFWYAVLKGFKLTNTKPYYIGMAYLYGYLSSYATKKNQIDDKEIRHYYSTIRPYELNQYYIKKLKSKLNLFKSKS